jgi:pyrimidine-nucleoside phosphorylase
LLLAIHPGGLDTRETVDLTEAMARSAPLLDLSEFPQPKIGQHSTGGVGDKAALIVAPVAAAAGILVQMMSGQGPAPTGDTVDKLESIPGFRGCLSLAEFRQVLQTCGLAYSNQPAGATPAMQKLCTLQQATGTAVCLPLMAASIMSKVLASGVGGVVVNVQTGAGAVIDRFEDSQELATRLVEIGAACGLNVQVLITDMSQPRGQAVGNTLEVIEAIETLKGNGPADLLEVCRELAAHMIVLAGLENSIEAAALRFDSLLASGSPLERLARVIAAQGGNPHVVEDYALLPAAAHEESVVAWQDGFIARLDAGPLGWVSMRLGAGRECPEAAIDPAVGLVFEKKIGDEVRTGERICTLWYNDRNRLLNARDLIRKAIDIRPESFTPPPLILARVPEGRRLPKGA